MTTLPGMDGALSDALVRSRRYFTRGTVSDDLRTLSKAGGRRVDDFYRDRWSHDKVVRSTHGVNCTGSCSWKVYVKDGIITWETAADRLPHASAPTLRSTSPAAARAVRRSPGTPTPRPASATRTSRGVLLQLYREAKAQPRRRPGPRLGAHRREPATGEGLQGCPRQGRPGARHLGRGQRDRRGRARPHDRALRPRPRGRLLAHSRDVDGLCPPPAHGS